MISRDSYRSLRWRFFVAVVLVLAFTGVVWNETGDTAKYLWLDLVIGFVLAALSHVAWWAFKRRWRASRAVLREAYQDLDVVQREQSRRIGRRLGELHGRRASARLPDGQNAVVRGAARHAGRSIGTLRRAFRDGYGSGK